MSLSTIFIKEFKSPHYEKDLDNFGGGGKENDTLILIDLLYLGVY
jgi:hypothetical protein